MLLEIPKYNWSAREAWIVEAVNVQDDGVRVAAIDSGQRPLFYERKFL
jgi:hypothetical protein